MKIQDPLRSELFNHIPEVSDAFVSLTAVFQVNPKINLNRNLFRIQLHGFKTPNSAPLGLIPKLQKNKVHISSIQQKQKSKLRLRYDINQNPHSTSLRWTSKKTRNSLNADES